MQGKRLNLKFNPKNQLKMKKVLLALIVLSITGCHMFKSKDELLTDKIWVLEKISHPDDSYSYYKKDDFKMTIKFYEDNSAVILENGGNKEQMSPWMWRSEDKSSIKFSDFPKMKNVLVTELKDSSLVLTKYKHGESDLKLYLFKPHNYSKWVSDEVVEMNKKTRE